MSTICFRPPKKRKSLFFLTRTIWGLSFFILGCSSKQIVDFVLGEGERFKMFPLKELLYCAPFTSKVEKNLKPHVLKLNEMGCSPLLQQYPDKVLKSEVGHPIAFSYKR